MALTSSLITTALGKGVSNYYYYKQVDKTRDVVQKLMDKAEQQMKALLSETFVGISTQQMMLFKRVHILLTEFSNTYSDQLDETIQKVSDKAFAILAEVDNILHQAVQELTSTPAMQDLLFRIETISMRLPMTDLQPRLVSTAPLYIVPPSSQDTNVIVKCIGYFPNIPNTTDKPLLNLHEKKIEPLQTLESTLLFSIPSKDLFLHQSPSSVKTTTFEVKIPYMKDENIIFYTYQGVFFLLPPSPGQVKIKYTKFEEHIEDKEHRSPVYTQSSRPIRKHGEDKTIIDRPYTLFTQNGWKIVPGSSRFDVIDNRGKHRKGEYRIQAEDEAHATFVVSTYKYEPHKHCGKISFQIAANLTRTGKQKVTSDETISLKWGQLISLDKMKGLAQVFFESFDGSTQEIHGKGPLVSLLQDRTLLVVTTPTRLNLSSIGVTSTIPSKL